MEKYIIQKKWKKLLKEIEAISDDEFKKILIKGRYPNNNTFPPLYRLIPEYKYSSSKIEYLCPRNNKTPRKYVIPDELLYKELVEQLCKCWREDDTKKSMYSSKSILALIKSNKRILPISSSFLRKTIANNYLNDIYRDSILKWKDFTQKYLYEDSINFNCIIDLDIKDCYAQIYIHAIPWALTGDKSKCKSMAMTDGNKYKKLLASKLENKVMNLQERQTNGLPVGSLGSDLLAEIILCRVVKNVEAKLKDFEFIGIRFKDDIKILCNQGDSNKIYDCLTQELSNYNLYLNDDKTKIHNNFSDLLIKDWRLKIQSLPSITFDLSKKKYFKGELSELESDLITILYKIDESFTANDGNFWFEFDKRYTKYFRFLVRKNSESKGRIIVWLLRKLNEYTQHTGAIMNIIMSLVDADDQKYLELVRTSGKDISIQRNFDFCMIWLIYFVAEKYLNKRYSKSFVQIFKDIETEIDEISNEDIKVESKKLLKYISDNKGRFKGYKPITKTFKNKWNYIYDYE